MTQQHTRQDATTTAMAHGTMMTTTAQMDRTHHVYIHDGYGSGSALRYPRVYLCRTLATSQFFYIALYPWVLVDTTRYNLQRRQLQYYNVKKRTAYLLMSRAAGSCTQCKSQSKESHQCHECFESIAGGLTLLTVSWLR